jgi:hemolysin activation/secretion protein
LGFGETFSSQALKSQGSDFLRLGSTLPLGYGGWRGGIHLSQLDFAIITPDADGRAQNIQGRSQSAGLDMSYPLVRSRHANMFVTASLDHRLYYGNANDLLNSDYFVQGGNIGLEGNFFDSWASKTAANSYSLDWRRGVVQDGRMPVLPVVQGSYSKLNWSLSRQQTLRSDLSLYTLLSGQLTGDKVLDGSENFSLGGPSRVRAYAVSEATGPQGYVLNLELRWRLSPQWLVTPFYDHGRIQKRIADVLPEYSLNGAGVSVTWTNPQGWTARATLAQRLGRNPNANAQTGLDQDGSLDMTRLWLTLSRSL